MSKFSHPSLIKPSIMVFFPKELKMAKVIPVYKSGSTMELNNYRPISVLNTFYKVFKRLMYDRLAKFLDKYNILYQNQVGFRQGHSTHHAPHYISR